MQFPTPRTIHLAILLAAFCAGTARAASVPGSSGATPGDPRHEIIVSVKEQKLLLLTDGKPGASYPVSTSKFGIGDRLGSYATPLGKFFVRMKIGMGQPLGAVFRSRRPTGEVLKPNAPGRDPIVTRILWLEGVEPGNEWPEEVGRALLGSNLFMVFMSAAAIDSRNVRNEINLASSENKNILVVFLQPADLSEGMKLQIGTVQYMNKYEMTEKEFYEKLKKTLDPALRG